VTPSDEKTVPRKAAKRSGAQRQRADIDAYMPGTEIRTIFDVGANTGATVARYHEAFPEAEIWAFEPVNATYQALVETTADLGGVRTFNVALGASEREGRITAVGTSLMNTLVEGDSDSGGPVQHVEILSGDAFCRKNGIDRIGLLKIDTEGHDLEVLTGFHGMLGSGRIDLVYVEAGMHARNLKHVPLERFKGYLEPIGFAVFRLYNLAAERRGGPHMRRADVLFVSPQLIERHTPSPGR
jgi:FkbM family methyltransferase